MQLKRKRWTKHVLLGVAALVTVAASVVGFAQPSHAVDCIDHHNATVKHQGGDYKAVFEHYGEWLRVEDHVTDGLAAVAYVRVYRFMRCDGEVPIWTDDPVDTDRFVMDHGEDRYNLGTPDGSGDVPEYAKVRIRVCKGYASNPGDNCSGWNNGFA